MLVIFSINYRLRFFHYDLCRKLYTEEGTFNQKVYQKEVKLVLTDLDGQTYILP